MSSAMINGVINAVVARSTKEGLKSVLTRWGRVDLDEIPGVGATKTHICATLQHIAKREQFTREIAGDFELAYMQLNSVKKLWKVYKMKGDHVMLNMNQRSLRCKLVNNLQVKMTNTTVDSNMSMFAGALWFRLHLEKHTRTKGGKDHVYKPSNSIFLVTYPGTSVFMISGGGVADIRLVLQALQEVTGADHIVDTHLSGRQQPSLADLALKPHQHPTDKYRAREEKENPISAQRSRKRKVDESSRMFKDSDNLVDETRPMKKRRQEIVTEAFGLGRQPVLEKIDYKFDVKCPTVQPGQASRCRAVIELKGNNVLEGLCSLAVDGYAKFPLPNHLSSVVSRSQNSFTIRDKS